MTYTLVIWTLATIAVVASKPKHKRQSIAHCDFRREILDDALIGAKEVVASLPPFHVQTPHVAAVVDTVVGHSFRFRGHHACRENELVLVFDDGHIRGGCDTFLKTCDTARLSCARELGDGRGFAARSRASITPPGRNASRTETYGLAANPYNPYRLNATSGLANDGERMVAVADGRVVAYDSRGALFGRGAPPTVLRDIASFDCVDGRFEEQAAPGAFRRRACDPRTLDYSIASVKNRTRLFTRVFPTNAEIAGLQSADVADDDAFEVATFLGETKNVTAAAVSSNPADAETFVAVLATTERVGPARALRGAVALAVSCDGVHFSAPHEIATAQTDERGERGDAPVKGLPRRRAPRENRGVDPTPREAYLFLRHDPPRGCARFQVGNGTAETARGRVVRYALRLPALAELTRRHKEELHRHHHCDTSRR